MVTGVYDPKWLNCATDSGKVKALAFTLSRQSPNYTGELSARRYRQIFSVSCGRYGTTLDYDITGRKCSYFYALYPFDWAARNGMKEP